MKFYKNRYFKFKAVFLEALSREIKRNKDQRSGLYKDDLANRKYIARQKDKLKHKRFTPEIRRYVDKLLKDDYSPEQALTVFLDFPVEIRKLFIPLILLKT